MAVENVPVGTTLRLQFQTGVDVNGNPVFRNKSLSNVKTDALDQNIFDVAQTLANLQEHILAGLLRIDTARLEEVI
ncbi:DUF1659 domain-containing protein [Desulfolucanica intricata]|uniref:DUF1659 domain-containing protein n=1 Tax=Desulfolucanica intricata TaxID=1285191 RepID=UPI0008350CD6|nr:DUF1659 domain-containing protein [Desulfolucanica intricata]